MYCNFCNNLERPEKSATCLKDYMNCKEFIIERKGFGCCG